MIKPWLAGLVLPRLWKHAVGVDWSENGCREALFFGSMPWNKKGMK